ncbi:MAG: biotin synthase BioB [Rhodospirillales bacterium]|nr:biotin synthase BioB [Rhodospirillales bacterium]
MARDADPIAGRGRPRPTAERTRGVCHDWTKAQAEALFELPFNDLIVNAQALHRRHFDANRVQMATLLSVKTGGCPEDCAYCPQAARYATGVKAERLMAPADVVAAAADVVAAARLARDAGATRYCMGAAWRSPKDADVESVCAMVEGVRALGMESCATLGMLTAAQARRLKQAGLDYYNHNIDTSEEFYGRIITTRVFQDRLDTLEHVRAAGIKVCCGGIVGMGESRADRAAMLATLARMDPHPESVPINMLVRVDGTPLADADDLDGIEFVRTIAINMLVRVDGTPLADADDLDGIEFVRTIAVAKTMMPASVIRLSAGREQMTDELQALCFLAGAGSIFTGDKLLTTANPGRDHDRTLFERLGLKPAVAGRGAGAA